MNPDQIEAVKAAAMERLGWRLDTSSLGNPLMPKFCVKEYYVPEEGEDPDDAYVVVASHLSEENAEFIAMTPDLIIRLIQHIEQLTR